jgi:hypothetical protein
MSKAYDWQRFAGSGKINDYLAYTSNHVSKDRVSMRHSDYEQASDTSPNQEQSTGEVLDERTDSRDRYGHSSSTFRRI